MQSSTTTPGLAYLTQQDKLVNYASVFVYNPQLRAQFKDYSPSLQSYESKLRPVSLAKIHRCSPPGLPLSSMSS